LTVSTALVVALASAGAAVADRVQTSKPDQAAAKSDVLRESDLPATVPWKASKFNDGGGGTPSGCANLDYGGTQIVDTGQAQSQFEAPGILVMNQVGLVSKASMVHLIWQHVFSQSDTSRCIRASFSEGAKGKVQVISTTRIAFPHLATYQSAYRILFQLTVQGKTLRGACDFVVFGGSRTISMLFVMGILGTKSQQASGEMDMNLIDASIGQKLAGRAFAPKSPSGLAA
jgi:hypothetical protein